MATEIAKAYVQIVPSTKGIKGAITKALNPEAKEAGEKMGKSISSDLLKNMSTGLKTVGKTLTNGLTKPIARTATALSALTFGKGWGRLSAIDDAKAKLTGLGHSAKSVESVMDSALKSVKGTSFGLGEAATTAAGAVAAGVKQGEDLTRYLSLVGDAAAIAGTDMGEMGSVFNKVMTSGKIQSVELNQLADRGIPIFQMLSDSMGVSADEIRNLSREGAISSEDFLNAIDHGFGGAAKKMGELSLSANIKNAGAALGRLGAAFLDAGGKGGGFFSQLQPLFTDLINLFDELAPKAEELGRAFGEKFAAIIEKIKELVDWFINLDGEQKKMIGFLVGAAAASGPFLTMLGNIVGTGDKVTKTLFGMGENFGNLALKIPGVATHFTKLTGKLSSFIGISFGMAGFGATIGIVIAAVGLLGSKFGTEINSMLNIAKTKGPQVIDTFVNGIVTKLPEIMKTGSEIIANLLDAISANLPSIMNGASEILLGLIQGINDNLDILLPSVINIITTLIEGIIQNLPLIMLAGFELIVGLVEGLANNIDLVIQSVISIIETIIITIIENLPKLLELGARLLIAIVQGIINAIPALLTGIASMGARGLEALMEVGGLALSNVGTFFLNMWNKAKEGGKNFVTGMMDFIKELPQKLGHIIGVVLGQVAKFAIDTWNKAKELGKNFVTGIIDFVKDLPQNFKNFLDRTITNIKTFATNAWNKAKEVGKNFFKAIVDEVKKIPGKLQSLGRDIVQGFFNGIQAMGNWLYDKVSGFFGGIVDGVKGVFGIKSPSRVFRDEVGKWIPRGLAKGIEENLNPINKAMDSMENELMRDFDTSYNVEGVASYTPYNKGSNPYGLDGGQSLINIENLVVRNDEDIQKIANELAVYINRQERG